MSAEELTDLCLQAQFGVKVRLVLSEEAQARLVRLEERGRPSIPSVIQSISQSVIQSVSPSVRHTVVYP